MVATNDTVGGEPSPNTATNHARSTAPVRFQVERKWWYKYRAISLYSHGLLGRKSIHFSRDITLSRDGKGELSVKPEGLEIGDLL